jgi:hypothetical protein
MRRPAVIGLTLAAAAAVLAIAGCAGIRVA